MLISLLCLEFHIAKCSTMKARNESYHDRQSGREHNEPKIRKKKKESIESLTWKSGIKKKRANENEICNLQNKQLNKQQNDNSLAQ